MRKDNRTECVRWKGRENAILWPRQRRALSQEGHRAVRCDHKVHVEEEPGCLRIFEQGNKIGDRASYQANECKYAEPGFVCFCLFVFMSKEENPKVNSLFSALNDESLGRPGN